MKLFIGLLVAMTLLLCSGAPAPISVEDSVDAAISSGDLPPPDCGTALSDTTIICELVDGITICEPGAISLGSFEYMSVESGCGGVRTLMTSRVYQPSASITLHALNYEDDKAMNYLVNSDEKGFCVNTGTTPHRRPVPAVVETGAFLSNRKRDAGNWSGFLALSGLISESGRALPNGYDLGTARPSVSYELKGEDRFRLQPRTSGAFSCPKATFRLNY